MNVKELKTRERLFLAMSLAYEECQTEVMKDECCDALVVYKGVDIVHEDI